MNLHVWDPMTDLPDHVHVWRESDFVRNVEFCELCACIRARHWWLDDVRVEVIRDDPIVEGKIDESSVRFVVFRREDPLPVPTLRPPAKAI